MIFSAGIPRSSDKFAHFHHEIRPFAVFEEKMSINAIRIANQTQCDYISNHIYTTANISATCRNHTIQRRNERTKKKRIKFHLVCEWVKRRKNIQSLTVIVIGTFSLLPSNMVNSILAYILFESPNPENVYRWR